MIYKWKTINTTPIPIMDVYSAFKGKSYSGEFTAHMNEIISVLEYNSLMRLCVHTDELCLKCPLKVDGVCKSVAKVAQYYKEVLNRCGLIEYNILIKGKREEVCGYCQRSDICLYDY